MTSTSTSVDGLPIEYKHYTSISCSFCSGIVITIKSYTRHPNLIRTTNTGGVVICKECAKTKMR